MGALCACEKTTPKGVLDGSTDLPQKDLSNISDSVTKAIYGYPFHRCHVSVWLKRVEKARKEDNQDMIDPKSFAQQFSTPAWKGELVEGGKSATYLGFDEEEVPAVNIQTLGLLLCAGDDSEKIMALMGIVNPPSQA